jgi:hypothetical protein
MYQLKNYMLSMQSHWYINQPLYQAVLDTLPMIAQYRASQATSDLKDTPIKKLVRQKFSDVYTVPLFRKQFCKLLVEEMDEMHKEIGFVPNADEDELRQIPEIVLSPHTVPELFRNMWFVVQNVLDPIFWTLFQRSCRDIASIQLCNYSPKGKRKGAWHHDESADISVVVPLNTGDYEGGGTEFSGKGILPPLPSGHALIFPSFGNCHRGLAVESGNRYLLVFWLYDRERITDQFEIS